MCISGPLGRLANGRFPNSVRYGADVVFPRALLFALPFVYQRFQVQLMNAFYALHGRIHRGVSIEYRRTDATSQRSLTLGPGPRPSKPGCCFRGSIGSRTAVR